MQHINFFIVFIEGVLSIFSPCILPILPIYLSMLSNSSIDDIKNSNFSRNVLLRNTILFTLGISTTFFILGSSISALTSFITTNKNMIMGIGGIIIVIMGLFYLGIIKSDFLSREKRLSVKYKAMSPITAFLLGFTFSFGWTPCIGPILASVLIMASTSQDIVISNLLILVYTIGFILPFIIASLFYNKLFKKFDKMKSYMKIIKGIGGVFIIIAGLVMIFNGFSNINKHLNIKNQNINQSISQNNISENNKENTNNATTNEKSGEDDKIAPINFTLYDQYGNKHTLSEYKGKTVFLNFWATWCPPCREEMPYIEKLYKEYGENKGDVIILGVATPNLGQEGSEEQIKKFLNKDGYTFPVVFDNDASMVFEYGISAFPTTLIINKEGYIANYIPGAMNEATMKKVINSEK